MKTSTNDFFVGLGVAAASALFIFFAMLLSTIGGIIGGWVVGIFFEGMILNALARFGVDTVNLALWQLGGTLGFIGSFFKSVQTNTTAKA